MTTMKLSELKESETAISHLLEARLPVRVSYALVKFMRVVKSELTDLEDARQKLIRDYGTKDEAGNTTVQADKMEEFVEEFKKLLDQDVTFDAHKVSLVDLEGASLTVGDVVALDFLIME